MSMFTMPPHQYGYAAPPVHPPPRNYPGGHGTSSAFSSSANPDEDWTKISDLAERRRIQNRIAQRNYRKKLKRRLEDLERRAGDEGSPGSTKQAQAQPNNSKTNNKRQQTAPKPQKVRKASPTPKAVAQNSQFTPPMHQDDELLFPSMYGEREGSHTPPLFSYSAYPPPDELIVSSYGPPHATYPTMTTAETYPTYLATTVPVTLPSMTHFSDAVKRDVYQGEDGLSPFMNYGFIPGIDVSSPPQYGHSNPHTPPLSHSFDHSANCSESGYEYPTTPLSMPGSPGMIQPH